MNMLLAIGLRFFGVFLSFSLNVYLSRALDKTDLGEYFLLLQILLVLSVLIRRGTDTSLLKYSHKMSEEDLFLFTKQYAKSTIIPLCLLSFILMFFSYLFLSYKLFSSICFILVSLIPFSIFNIAAEYIKGLNHQVTSTIIQACLLPIFVFIFFYTINLNIYFSYALAVTLIMILSLYRVKKISLGLFRLKNNSKFKETNFWIDSKTFMLVGVLNIVMNSMDLIMLGAFKSPEIVAEYGVSNKLVALSSVLLIGVNGLLGPKFSALWQEQKNKEIYTLFIKATFLMFILALFLLLFFIGFGEIILTTIYGNEYSNGSILLVILAIGQSIVLSTGPVAYLLMMTDSKHIHQRAMVLAVTLNLLLNLTLIPIYGAIGAAVATAISLIIKNLYSFNYLLFKTEFRKMKYVK